MIDNGRGVEMIGVAAGEEMIDRDDHVAGV